MKSGAFNFTVILRAFSLLNQVMSYMFQMNPLSRSPVLFHIRFLRKSSSLTQSFSEFIDITSSFIKLVYPQVQYFSSIRNKSSLSFLITNTFALLSFLANQPPSKNCTHAYLSPYPFMRGEHNATSYDSAVSKYLCPQMPLMGPCLSGSCCQDS